MTTFQNNATTCIARFLASDIHDATAENASPRKQAKEMMSLERKREEAIQMVGFWVRGIARNEIHANDEFITRIAQIDKLITEAESILTEYSEQVIAQSR